MHHLIYLPQHNTANVAHLAKAGLADHAAGAQMTALDGLHPLIPGEPAAGVVCSWGSSKPKLRELPRLTWLPAMPLDGLPARRYFVGVDPSQPPRPHELLKHQPHPGPQIGLGDGQLWVVPLASELPFDIVRHSETGEIQMLPQPAYAGFWSKALAWEKMFLAHQEGDPLPDVVEQVEFLEEALRLNYRLPPELVSWLKLMHTGPLGTLRACLAACQKVEPGGVP